MLLFIYFIYSLYRLFYPNTKLLSLTYPMECLSQHSLQILIRLYSFPYINFISFLYLLSIPIISKYFHEGIPNSVRNVSLCSPVWYMPSYVIGIPLYRFSFSLSLSRYSFLNYLTIRSRLNYL